MARCESLTEMDRHTLHTIQRAVKQKARKVGRPIVALDGERILYCMRCLKSNYEVEAMVWEPFLCICTDCIRDLAIFAEHVIREKQGHTQAQPKPDEGESAQDRQAIQDEEC